MHYIRHAQPRSKRRTQKWRIGGKSLRECSLRVSVPTLRASRRRRSTPRCVFFDSDPTWHVSPSADADLSAAVFRDFLPLEARQPARHACLECRISTFFRIFGHSRLHFDSNPAAQIVPLAIEKVFTRKFGPSVGANRPRSAPARTAHARPKICGFANIMDIHMSTMHLFLLYNRCTSYILQLQLKKSICVYCICNKGYIIL